MLEKFENIGAGDLDLCPIMDDPDEIVEYIRDFYSGETNQLKPNLEL